MSGDAMVARCPDAVVVERANTGKAHTARAHLYEMPLIDRSPWPLERGRFCSIIHKDIPAPHPSGKSLFRQMLSITAGIRDSPPSAID